MILLRYGWVMENDSDASYTHGSRCAVGGLDNIEARRCSAIRRKAGRARSGGPRWTVQVDDAQVVAVLAVRDRRKAPDKPEERAAIRRRG